MRSLILKLLFIFCCVLFWADQISAQARILPFGIKESSLITEIRALRTANPKITDSELAKAANDLFQTSGISFKVYFDAANCKKIRDFKQSQKDPNAPVKLGAQFQSFGADKVSLALPQPILTTVDCGDCYIELPILEITDADFVTPIQGHNIKFQLPPNFTVNKAFLLDNKDPSHIIKSWRIPYRTMPIGVSYDQSVLYVGFENPELSALSVAVFDSGAFEVTTRAEAEDGGLGKLVKTDKPSESGGQIVRFDRWKTTYLINYKPPC